MAAEAAAGGVGVKVEGVEGGEVAQAAAGTQERLKQAEGRVLWAEPNDICLIPFVAQKCFLQSSRAGNLVEIRPFG